MDNENKLMLGLPKGSLEESTIRLFAKANIKLRRAVAHIVLRLMTQHWMVAS